MSAAPSITQNESTRANAMSRKLAAKMPRDSGFVMASRASGTAAETISPAPAKSTARATARARAMFGTSAQEAQHGDDQECRRDHRQPSGAGARHSVHQVADADDIDAERSWPDASRGHGGVELAIGEHVAARHKIVLQPWAAMPGR